MNPLTELLRDLPGPDLEAAEAVRDRAASVLRPAGALARLDEVAVWLAGWQRTAHPAVERPAVTVFAADHGIAAAGVSAYPAEVTKAMLAALEQGVATSAVLAQSLGARFEALDVGVGEPTGDIRTDPALDLERFATCVAAGATATDRAADEGADLLVVGEMGIGNTTPAAAICAALFGGDAASWTGRGTGVDDEGLARKIAAVEAAQARIAGVTDPLEVLRQVGGAEIVAMSAAIAQARRRSVPVVLDGFVVGAAAAPLAAAAPRALDHCLASHRSAEPGHRLLLERLAMTPLLDLDLRLGEASGALVAIPIVRAAAVAVTDVATFQEWGLA